MPNPHTLLLLCLLAGCSLLQGCSSTLDSATAANMSSEIINPHPVIQKAAQKSMKKTLNQEESSAASTESSAMVALQKPVPAAVPTTTQVTQPSTPAASRVAQKPAPSQQASRVKTIKPGTPTSKANAKLTPKEVDDIIRKLSVCRPH